VSPVATQGNRGEGGSRGEEVIPMGKRKPPAGGSRASSESIPKRRLRRRTVVIRPHGRWVWDDRDEMWHYHPDDRMVG